MEIDDIIAGLKNLAHGDNINRKTLEMVMAAELLGHEKYQAWTRSFPFGAITSDLTRSRQLFLRAFPGWCYRVAECSVSDDAWVIPDFNHPEHGAGLQKQFPDALKDPLAWFDSDVDLRPAGQPALAFCISMLLAKKKINETNSVTLQ